MVTRMTLLTFDCIEGTPCIYIATRCITLPVFVKNHTDYELNVPDVSDKHLYSVIQVIAKQCTKTAYKQLEETGALHQSEIGGCVRLTLTPPRPCHQALVSRPLLSSQRATSRNVKLGPRSRK